MNTTFNSMYSGMEYEESMLLEGILKNLSPEQKTKFLLLYQSRRQDKNSMLIFILLGFGLISGVHRFVIGDIALGILYLLTGGLCYIGTIVDLINYKSITLDYNRKKMQEVAVMMGLNVSFVH